MPTIGERLLAQTAAREEAKRVLDDRKLAHALEDLKDAVEDNREFKGRKIDDHYSMPYRFSEGRKEFYFWQEGHPYHDEFKAMAAKARLEGLEFDFQHDHDGVGMKSWISIQFKPLAVYDKTNGL